MSEKIIFPAHDFTKILEQVKSKAIMKANSLGDPSMIKPFGSEWWNGPQSDDEDVLDGL